MFESVDQQSIRKSIEKITRSDISREIPSVGETEIIMQRHEKYIRDIEHERVGSLEPEEAKKAHEQAMEVMESKLAGLSKEELQSVYVLVIASNTRYIRGMRSFETANEVVRGVSDVFEKHGLDRNHLLNSQANVNSDNQEIVASKVKTIQEPRMFTDSPDFVKYLGDKYGHGTQEFWVAFEEDQEREMREKMGAEGVGEILERYAKFIDVLRNFSAHYHAKHPGRRLIIWPVSHYDTISPYVKKIAGIDNKEYLGVDYGAGISVRINKDGRASSEIQGHRYDIDLKNK